MKIFYWAPWIGNVGTIKAVINSSNILKKYSKNKISTKIIDAVGEWHNHQNFGDFINLTNKKIYNYLPKNGYIKSRFTYFVIFLYSFFPLLKLLKKEKPDYLIVQLITSLPILLNLIFNLNTKLILRISGFPKMNFIRVFLWKVASKKIYKVTFPSYDLYVQFKNLNIFEENKMQVLYDPIINYKEIIKKKNDEEITYNLASEDYILSIGRLTKQKNFLFLVNNFKKIKNKYKNIKLFIIGEGELKKNLEIQIKNLKLEDDIKLLGFQPNVYKYLKFAKLFILTSLWEEIGFTIVEAAACNINILSSNCKNGPREFLQDERGGYLFQNNNSESFINKFNEFINDNEKKKKEKKFLAKKETKKFTFLTHYQSLIKILNN
jgi:glycosyltransferase involved in cell wall biosynthesis